MSGDFGLVDVDPVTGIADYVHDLDDNVVGFQSLQDAEPIVEANKLFYNSTDERARHKSEAYNRVASIPLTVWYDLKQKGIADDPVAFRKWLNDRDNLAFRTRPGRV